MGRCRKYIHITAYTRPAKVVPGSSELVVELFLVPEPQDPEATGSGSRVQTVAMAGLPVGRSNPLPRVTNPAFNTTHYFRMGTEQLLKVAVLHQKDLVGQTFLAEVHLNPKTLPLPFHGFVNMQPCRTLDPPNGPPILEFTLKLNAEDRVPALVQGTVQGMPGPMSLQALAASAPVEDVGDAGSTVQGPTVQGPAANRAENTVQGPTIQGPRLPAAGPGIAGPGSPVHVDIWDHNKPLPPLVKATLTTLFTIDPELWKWRPHLIAEHLKQGSALARLSQYNNVQGAGSEVQGSGVSAPKQPHGINLLALGFCRQQNTYPVASQLYAPAKIFTPLTVRAARAIQKALKKILLHPDIAKEDMQEVRIGLTVAEQWAANIALTQMVWGPMVAHALALKHPLEATPSGDYLPVAKLKLPTSGSEGSGSQERWAYFDYTVHVDPQIEWLKAVLLTLDAWVESLDKRASGEASWVQGAGSRAPVADPDLVQRNREVLQAAFPRFCGDAITTMPGTELLQDKANIIGVLDYRVSASAEVYMNQEALGIEGSVRESWWVVATGIMCPPAISSTPMYTIAGYVAPVY